MELLKLVKQFSKRHPLINGVDLYRTIQESDPTINSRPDNLGQPIFYQGDYSVWIANQCVEGNIKAGDAPELKAALTTYDRHKSHLKPIKEVKDLTELIDLVKNLSDDFKPTRCISKGEQGLEKVYEDEEWTVYIPHTFEASRKIGGDTHWCTAASNGQERFDYYTNQGPLYVNIRKSDGEKFQFHFETDQFMDKEDKMANVKKIGFNDGIIEFYDQVYKNFNLLMTCYSFYAVNEQYAIIGKNKNNYNVINRDTLCELFVDDMDCIYDYPEIYILRKSGKFMLTKFDGTFIFDDWFDEFKALNRLQMLFKKGGKWFLINNDGKTDNPEGFDDVLPIYTDMVGIMRGICVKQENKWKALICKHEYFENINDIWHSDDVFDDAQSMLNGKVIKLIKNNKAKFIFNHPGITYCIYSQKIKK